MTKVPDDFSNALKDSGLVEFFSGCAVSHRQEYLKWITDAKRPETRQERIKKAVKMLSEKRDEKAARWNKEDHLEFTAAFKAKIARGEKNIREGRARAHKP